MRIEDYLKTQKTLIDGELDKLLPSGKEGPKTIHKAMRYSVFSGGKRIRPIIAIESAKTCGGRMKDVLAIACSIELVHTYSLIHDDLPGMDDDDYRRGEPACHKVFGEGAAILAGDALLTLAFSIMAKSGKADLEAIRELSKAIGAEGMIGGQALDLEYKGKRKSRARSARINRLKTAKLFEVSAKLGTMAASAGKREVEAMTGFGEKIGIVFQAVDDILDREAPPGSIRECERLTEKAKGYLKIFGKRADRLKEIADHILTRKK